MFAYRVIPYGSEDYRNAVALREKILRLPLGLTTRTEDIADDHRQLHMAAFDEVRLLACVSAVPMSHGKAKLRQMAVAQDAQGKGVGRALLAFAERHLKELGYNALTLHARTNAEGFYTASGYSAEGERFTEVGLPHIRMRKTL